ncbi:MAG: oligoribonuclease [Actinomycetota bacterium]|jgi:oligoribonuclease|nr:oligoribonuclease [Actinomycetota bacterium]
MADRNDRLVWIDCEMTGLSLEHDALVEVAVLVTDSDLQVLGEGVDVVIKPPQAAIDQMPDVVRDMHTASGLLDELDHGMTLAEAEARVLAYVREHVPVARRAPLAGNTVYVDRGFLARDMATLDEHLHYRLVDVSSLKELARRWYPRVYFNSPAKHGGHRALADIRESIEELKYYREALFVSQPGPDTETVKALGERFTLPSDPLPSPAEMTTSPAPVARPSTTME